MKKKLSLFFVAVLTMVVLAACGTGDENSSTTSSGKSVLKVGMEAAYAPFNWSQNDDSNGAVQIGDTKEYAAGYDVEIAKRIAERSAPKVENLLTMERQQETEVTRTRTRNGRS